MWTATSICFQHMRGELRELEGFIFLYLYKLNQKWLKNYGHCGLWLNKVWLLGFQSNINSQFQQKKKAIRFQRKKAMLQNPQQGVSAFINALASHLQREKKKTMPKGLFSFAEISLQQKLLNLQASKWSGYIKGGFNFLHQRVPHERSFSKAHTAPALSEWLGCNTIFIQQRQCRKACYY